MQVSSLPTESEIYNQKNIQIEQTCIKMNIYDPPMNNNVNQEESNGDINQTQETLVVNNNINQLSLEKLEFNTHNYPLTENRNISPAPFTIEQKVMIFSSVNPNTNYPKKGIIDNQNIQQKIDNNVITVPTTINNPPEEVTKEESESDDICFCILKIIIYLVLLPIVILVFCIILCCCSEEEKKESDCFSCFKRKRSRR